MDSEWVKLPAGAVSVGHERPVRLSAGMNEPLAPAPCDGAYAVPVTYWWRRAIEPAAAEGQPPVLTR